ncbi:acyl-CoA synthetase [Corynebacterium ulcerans]|uniref:Acetyl-coenzyme A synthetase n=1 Tax=Corynebacterium ulcerans FRC58 TaxID=1408268 RepID=A0ABM5TYH2_CORUL|nr:acyl-CoA synthetase [Corynebacterium ulcerans]AKN76186.1 Acetyl-coenzyme A synthetase [Corynebacterium ulcerans FRC58]
MKARLGVPSTLKAMIQLAPTLISSGILSVEGNPSAFFSIPQLLARYRFTTAREVEQAYRICPHRIALIDDDGTLTFSQLRNDSLTVARHFKSLGLDDLRIGVMARNGRASIYPLTAKGYVGASIYLLNIGSSPEQLAGCIKRDGINVLVIDEEFVDRLPADLTGLHVIVGHREETPAQRTAELLTLDDIVKKPWETAGVSLPTFPKHGSIVLMSSGTTGIPKGVMRKELTAPTVLESVLTQVPWRANMTIQLTGSIFHTWGWACLNIAFGLRCTVITRRVFDPQEALADVQKHQIDGMISSPIFLKQFFAVEGQENYDCSSLTFIFSSGHSLSPWLVDAVHERFGKILCNLYGSTEISAAAIASMEEIAKNPAVAGKICKGTQLVILDDNDNPVGPGVPGRIFCHNNLSLTGYTDPTIPIQRVGDLVQIGDRGYIDENNYLFVLGRADDMIIVGGENVYPRSVEEVLEHMAGIADLYASGVEDEAMFERIAVWIVREDSPEGAALTEDSIRDWVKNNLAEHSIPRDVHFVDSLPRNATGKVIPRMLKP